VLFAVSKNIKYYTPEFIEMIKQKTPFPIIEMEDYYQRCIKVIENEYNDI
jgi:hypothetical protein